MFRKLILLTSFVLVLGLAAGLASAQSVNINFQQPSSDTPEGYLPDTSQVFGDRGNGFSYGWDVAFDETRDRNSSNAPDQRYDTLNHLQKAADRIWEIALDNAIYDIFLVCGDPDNTDQTNNFDVEGTILTDPDGQDNFDEYQLTVVVSDGRLTIKPAPGSDNCKIMFVDIILAIPPGAARGPDPANEATDVPRDVVLSWAPGDYAPAVNGHRVHLSESFSDVNDGIGGITQSATSYDPGRLNFGATYYWRVDEVNAPPDSTVHPGDVWSFATEPVGYPIDGANITATASSAGGEDFGPEKTIDGSGLDDSGLHSTDATDMWLSDNEPLGAWLQYELDKVYKLHEMWVWNSNQVFEGLFGFGLKNVTVEYSTDGADWTALVGVPEFARAPGTDGYAHDTTLDFGGAAAKYVRLTAASNWGGLLPQYGLSEVRFFFMPVSAREPSPDSGATDVDVDAILGWRAGREAATHDVYLSADEQAVIDGTASINTVTDASYSPSPLDLGSTYYWRIDEANDAETPTMWQGDVWSFSTPEYLVVDGFEDYND
ncbi:MAG: discoidin domain-containing protein, partial [Phycisphaerales bacterium]